jgi:hypothetical protein
MQLQLKNGKPTWKQGWANVGDKRCYFRSKWEFQYACFLQYLKLDGKIIDWEHEPDTFWFENIQRGTRSYMPDFKVTHNNQTYEYVEVKGYMDSKSQTKIKRMAIYYPEIKLRVVGKDWFKENREKIKRVKIFSKIQ